MKNIMKKTITKEFFDEYATKLIDFYEKNEQMKDALLNIGLDPKNMISLYDCFAMINSCFGKEFLMQGENLDSLFELIDVKEINIDKLKFVRIINQIEKMDKKIDESSKIIRKLSDNEWDVYFPTGEFLLNDFLNDIFDDNEVDDIGYFIYELEFGSKWHEGMVLDKNGNDIPLKDASDLYDLLLSK